MSLHSWDTQYNAPTKRGEMQPGRDSFNETPLLKNATKIVEEQRHQQVYCFVRSHK
jgi:hypothetical protein